LLPPVDPARIAEVASAASMVERDPAAGAYVAAVRDSPFVRDLIDGKLPFEWAATRMLSDDPAKGLGLAEPETLVSEPLKGIIGSSAGKVDLVSAYFVPTEAGADAFAALAQRGVNIRILTNALEATDVPAVHAGYAKRRKPLLEAGITLYELRLLSQNGGRKKGADPMGSSGSSLHSKTFAVDRSRVFIGSFNFDPRSAKLNTELGFIIESPALARRISTAFENGIPEKSYRVHLSETNDLYWTEHREGEMIRHDTEPNTSFWKRVAIYVISLLPIEWLL
jgi:putative cardiolipin synthase